MRVNIYAEEMTNRIEIIAKEIEGTVFTGLRFYLELPVTLRGSRVVDGAGVESNALNADMVRAAPAGLHAQGPFQHGPGDDDSGAITFWGKRDLREVLRQALDLLDKHYEKTP